MSGSASILPLAETQFVDTNGHPLAGGSVFFYVPGTTTLKTTWQDAAQTIANPNPVILDAAGRALIYGVGTYRQQVFDAMDNLIWDQVTSSNALVDPIMTPQQFGAKGDGTTDDTAAINAAEVSLSGMGGGILYFLSGTYITTGLTKLSNTIWMGAGIGVTNIKLQAGTTTNAVVAGQNAYTLFGSGSNAAGIFSFVIRDITIDGNKAAGCTSDGIGIYGATFALRAVEIQNCNGRGLRTEFAHGAPPPHLNVQSWFSDMEIHGCTTDGFYYCGPNDSVVENSNFYYCLRYGIWCSGAGTGKFNAVHCWGDGIGGLGQSLVGIRLDSPLNLIENSAFEGATQYEVWLRADSQTINGALVFYNQSSPNTAIGIRIGDSTGSGGGVVPVSNNTIRCRIDNCGGGALQFDDDLGNNLIEVLGYNNSPSVGYSGTPGSGSRIRMTIGGASVTNPLINSEGEPLQLAGDVTVTGGFAFYHLGTGGGAVTAGAADSGGTGFRMLVVPN